MQILKGIEANTGKMCRSSGAPLCQPKVSIAPILSLLMFISLFTGLQGGRYYAGNIAQELGILCAASLFIIGGFLCLFHMPRPEWNRWVLNPCILMLGIICLWGALFAFRFGGNPLHNILASREFFFILLAPGIYFCGRAGFSLKSIERVVWAVILVSMANYLFNYFRLDLQEAFFSADHRISSLVTYDEWRGFRLKPPLFAIMIGLLSSLAVLLSRASFAAKIFALVVATSALYIWSIVMFRSTLATMLLSVILYPLLLNRPNRMHLLILMTPICVMLSPLVMQILFQHFVGADGGEIRLASYQLALQEIPKNFLLGIGEDSAFGQTYASLYGPTFYPSDLGLVGITFKYGLIGLCLYLFMHFGILFRLCKTNWLTIEKLGCSHPLVFALLIFFCAQTFNLILNPGLAYAQGITLASLAVALCALIRHSLLGMK